MGRIADVARERGVYFIAELGQITRKSHHRQGNGGLAGGYGRGGDQDGEARHRHVVCPMS